MITNKCDNKRVSGDARVIINVALPGDPSQCAQEGGREVVGIFHMIPKFDVIFFVESGHTRGKTYFWDIQRIFNVFLSDFFGFFRFFSNSLAVQTRHKATRAVHVNFRKNQIGTTCFIILCLKLCMKLCNWHSLIKH